MPQPGAVDFSSYKAVRDEIAHEDNLVGTRLNWFFASQAFLLSALAIAYSSTKGAARMAMPNVRNDFYFPLIPILGIASCFFIFLGIVAGAVAIRRWRHLLNEMVEQNPALPAIGRDGLIMRFGWAAPLVLPVMFFIAWAYLLATGLSG